MRFSYIAVTKDGKTIRGTIDAVNRESLIANLAKQEAHPIVIREGATKRGRKNKNAKVKLKSLVMFTRQLSTMVSAGVPLTRCLVTLQAQADNKYLSEVIGAITKDIESGIGLGDAMAKYPRVFSEVYVSMVRAGESGGIMDEILKRLATQVEQDSSIRKKVKSAMTYPIVILSITVVAFFGIMLFVIPKIGEILTDLGGPDAKLPIYTQALLDMSNFLVSSSIVKVAPGISAIPVLNQLPNALFLIGLMVVALIYVRRYVRTPKGKLKLHGLLLRLPVIRTIITKVAIARFSRTFASLMSAGVSVLDSLAITGNAIGNKVIEAELRSAAEDVKNGMQLSEPLAQSAHFPPIVAQMLAVGEETGQIDTILLKVADFYEEEVENTIDSLSSIIEPLMIVVLGGIVGLIAASVMGPIASLSKNIGG